MFSMYLVHERYKKKIKELKYRMVICGRKVQRPSFGLAKVQSNCHGKKKLFPCFSSSRRSVSREWVDMEMGTKKLQTAHV